MFHIVSDLGCLMCCSFASIRCPQIVGGVGDVFFIKYQN